MFKRRPRQQTKRGSKRSMGTTGVTNPNIPVRLVKMMTAKMWMFLRPLGRADSVHRSSEQLSRLSDRTRLRRLKNTLIEDLCHTHVSNNWLYLDACAGSVLTPHDYITNVQKRLGNRAWTGFGQCRLCGSFLDPQLEHGETCSTAEATRGHHACVRTLSCVDKNLQTQALRPNPEGSQQRNTGRQISSLLSQDAARPWMCV